MSVFPNFAHGRIVPACRGEDISLFFPPRGSNGDEGKAICARCPLRKACRAWALAQPADRLYGIWGGMSDNDRNRWRAARKPRPARRDRAGRFLPAGIGKHHDTIAALLAQGRPWQEIAAAVGFSREGVRKYWQRQALLAETEAAR